MNEALIENFSKFKNLYKTQLSTTSNNSQEKRRQLLLNEQKERRFQLQNSLRNIESFSKKIQNYHQRKSKKFKHQTYSEKFNNDYSLQLSEWLKEKPEDLSNWYLVPCPKGKRCLVISTEGCTEIYNKNGRYLNQIHTMLPGDGVNKKSVTILDCIYIEKLSLYFVLDILVYNDREFINCETEFRFYWIKTKFSDEIIDDFMPILYYDFEDEYSISSCLSKYPQWTDENIELDGFLFYHKEASYTCGTTPLVGWLFGFMIPEILNLKVNDEYMKEKPLDYVDHLHYITEFDEKISKRNHLVNKRRNKKMEEDSINSISDVDDNTSNDTSNDVNEILEEQKMLEMEEDK